MHKNKDALFSRLFTLSVPLAHYEILSNLAHSSIHDCYSSELKHMKES